MDPTGLPPDPSDGAPGQDADGPLRSGAGERVEVTSYLCFRIGALRYALPARAVEEIVHAERPVPVPTAPPCFLGVVPLRGRVVAVADLAGLRGGVREQGHVWEREGRLVVFRAPGGLLALAADHAEGVRSLPRTELRPIEEEGSPAWLAGRFDGGQSVVTLLDPDRLFEAFAGALPEEA